MTNQKKSTDKKNQTISFDFNLANVILCGGNGGGGGRGGRLMRTSMEAAIGDMLLQHWSGVEVGNPLPYFEKYMEGPKQPSQKVVENTLKNAFSKGFSATLNNGGLSEVKKSASSAMLSELKNEGLSRPVTQGFRDLLFHVESSDPTRNNIPRDLNEVNSSLPNYSNSDQVALNEASETLALKQTLGSFVLDILSGYPVSNIAVGFQANGGRDSNIISALNEAYSNSFSKEGNYKGLFGKNLASAFYKVVNTNNSEYKMELSTLYNTGKKLV